MTQTQRVKSMEDIARLAGVSKSTVSRALSDSPLIGVETKERIVAIAREHDFRASVAARSLSLRASRTVAYVIDAYDDECGLESPFSLELMGGAATGLRELGYDMLIAQADEKRGDWAADYLGSGRVDGFILMTYENKRRHVERLLELDAPFSVWGPCGDVPCCSVASDNRGGGRLAGAHIVSLGRKRPGFIGGPSGDVEVIARRRGYLEGLGGDSAPLRPVEAYGDFTQVSGYRAALELLDARPDLDSLFAAGDLMAIGAMKALASRGRLVPDDVAVIGYDDLYVSGFTTPALTTVSQHIADSGRALVKSLVARIERGVVADATVPVELIRRDSA